MQNAKYNKIPNIINQDKIFRKLVLPTNRQMDGQCENNIPPPPLSNFVCGAVGYKKKKQKKKKLYPILAKNPHLWIALNLNL